MGINVLSFFDGISAGQEALKQIGVQVDNYYAVEISPSAIKVTQNRFPKTIQMGNILRFEKNIRRMLEQLPTIDLIFAGSPCQGFSKGGKTSGFNDPRSRLYNTFISVWRKINQKRNVLGLPPVPFFFENVKMRDTWAEKISNDLGVPYMDIKGGEYSANLRRRYYWTNLSVPASIMGKFKSDEVYKDIRMPNKGIPNADRFVYLLDPKNSDQERHRHNTFYIRCEIKNPDGTIKNCNKNAVSMATIRHQDSHGWRINRFNMKIPCFLTSANGFDNGLNVIGYPAKLWTKAQQAKIESLRSNNNMPVITVTIKNSTKAKFNLSDNKFYAVRVSTEEALSAMGFPEDYFESSDIKMSEKIEGIGNSWSVVVVKMLIESYCTRMGWTR